MTRRSACAVACWDRPGLVGRLFSRVAGVTIRIAAVLVLTMAPILMATSARADQTDAALPPLFDRLAQPGLTEQAARRLELEIWVLWGRSGSPTVDLLMGRGKQFGDSPQELSQAIALFDAAVALAPEFAEAWNKRATAHYLLGDYDASIRDIEQTLRLEPRHFGALSGLGIIMVELGEAEKALRAFRLALEINPHLSDITEEVRRLEKDVEGQGI